MSKVDASNTDIAVAETNEIAPSGAGTYVQRDIDLPRLSICNATGKLGEFWADKGGIGNIVLDDFNLGKEVEVIVLDTNRFWEESLPHDAPDRPQRFGSVADWRDAGFIHISEGDGAHQVHDVGDFVLLVRDDEDGEIDLDGGLYHLVTFSGRKYNFNATYGRYNRQRQFGALKDDTTAKSFKLRVEKKSNSKNTWYAPAFSPGSEMSDSFRSQAKEVYESLSV